MLEVKNLHVYYGNIHAIKGISFYINQGEIVSIIGSNGAGKSTTMNALAGIKPYKSGQIFFEGKNLTKCKNNVIVKEGIVLVPEGRQVFPHMSVEENLMLGAYLYANETAQNLERLKEMYSLFPRLEERKHQKASTLSGGEQQMLAVARGRMSRPKILMLDEPSLGLAPIIIQRIFNMLIQINKEFGTTILLVEQNARAALNISNRAYVLENGEILLEGDAKALKEDKRVQDAYL